MCKIFLDNRVVIISNCVQNQMSIEEALLYQGKDIQNLAAIVKKMKSDVSVKKIILTDSEPKELKKRFFANFIHKKAAGGVVLNAKGEILVIKRNGIWDLPKGHLEKGEKKRDGAIREVIEECGIKPLTIIHKLGKTYHIYPYRKEYAIKTTYWYQMTYNGNKKPVPQTKEHISEVQWIKPENIATILNNTHE